MSNQPQPNREPSGHSRPWDRTSSCREEIFREMFGVFPTQVIPCPELMSVWPGGCLVEFRSPKLGGLRVTSTFGLTNSDLPTDKMVSGIEYSFDTISAKTTRTELLTYISEPLPALPGRSGYGYELVALNREQSGGADSVSEAQALGYLAGFQLRDHRFNILDEIDHRGGVIYQTICQSSGEGKRYLLTKFWDLLGESASLPHGSMELVCLMEIANAELSYGRRHGLRALVQLMKDSGVPPVNDGARPSVV